jgi:hypothetical protein
MPKETYTNIQEKVQRSANRQPIIATW